MMRPVAERQAARRPLAPSMSYRRKAAAGQPPGILPYGCRNGGGFDCFGPWTVTLDGLAAGRMVDMASFKCSKCGYEKEARCKPQKCPQCGEKKTFEKAEEKKA